MFNITAHHTLTCPAPLVTSELIFRSQFHMSCCPNAAMGTGHVKVRPENACTCCRTVCCNSEQCVCQNVPSDWWVPTAGLSMPACIIPLHHTYLPACLCMHACIIPLHHTLACLPMHTSYPCTMQCYRAPDEANRHIIIPVCLSAILTIHRVCLEGQTKVPPQPNVRWLAWLTAVVGRHPTSCQPTQPTSRRYWYMPPKNDNAAFSVCVCSGRHSHL